MKMLVTLNNGVVINPCF